jgi:hypothetical protein
MQTGSDLDPEFSDALGDLECAADRPGRSVEGGVETVPSGVVLDPPPVAEGLPNDRVVLLD